VPLFSERLRCADVSFTRLFKTTRMGESIAKELRPSRPQEVSPSFASLQDGATAPPYGWVIPLLLQLLPPTLAASGRVAWSCNPISLTTQGTLPLVA